MDRRAITLPASPGDVLAYKSNRLDYIRGYCRILSDIRICLNSTTLLMDRMARLARRPMLRVQMDSNDD